MRLLICGDRKWNDYEMIANALREIRPSLLIEGEANGADIISRIEAEILGIPVLKFPADWNKYGKSAGPIRNTQMLKEGKPDMVIAFHDNIESSKGTKHMVTIANRANIPTKILGHSLQLSPTDKCGMMKEIIGNIWDWYERRHWIVITTNIGWKSDGSNPMGAGIAKKAAEIDPELPMWYGAKCKKYGSNTATLPYKKEKFILFPTKPLDIGKPWLSWQQDSNLALIARSTKQLAKLADILCLKTVVLPMVGCGNGGLQSKQVLPVLRHYLDDRFILVHTRL